MIFNYIVDPFFIHQCETSLLNRLSPAHQKIVPWAKTYCAYIYNPDVIYLGSSRSEIGLPVEADLFKNKKILNLALSGGTPDDAIDILSHACNFHCPEIVIWGIEYGWLFNRDDGNTDLDQDLLASNSFYPFFRFLLNLKRSLTVDASIESIKIAMNLSEKSCLPIMATFGHKSDECMREIMNKSGGTTKAFEKILKHEKTPEVPRYTEQIAHLDESLSEFCKNKISMRLFIQPNHVLSELNFLNEWDVREKWMNELVDMIDKQEKRNCDIKLYDFSGFNMITTENIPQSTGLEDMHYYWEQSHYKKNVGQMILNRIISKDNIEYDDDFGIELTKKNISQHINKTRELMNKYIQSHPYETKNFTTSFSDYH